MFRFFLLRWHRRARKTTLILNMLIRECCRNEKKIYGYIAPTYTQAKGIVWTDPNMLDAYLPKELVLRKNESELLVEFKTKSILAIKGGDNPDSIRGEDYEGVGIDEFALLKLGVWEEILRPVIAQSKDRFALFAFTPKGLNHAFDYWNKAEGWEGWHKSLLKASESGIITQDELELAKKQMPLALYNQEFECDFMAGEEFCLIKPEMIMALNSRVDINPVRKKILTCDPATGNDECVIYVMDNSRILEAKYLYYDDTMKIVGEIMLLMEKYHLNDCAIDTIGIGKGIVDRLQELNRNVLPINSAEEAIEKDRFSNKRSEMWWYAMEQIQNKEVEPITDSELIKQLTSVYYKPPSSNGKLGLELKQDTKKRLGRSPDRADAFIYGLWALKEIKETTELNTESFRKLKHKPVFAGAAAW